MEPSFGSDDSLDRETGFHWYPAVGALDVRDPELVDMPVEGIGDATHMPADAKGSCVDIDGQLLRRMVAGLWIVNAGCTVVREGQRRATGVAAQDQVELQVARGGREVLVDRDLDAFPALA